MPFGQIYRKQSILPTRSIRSPFDDLVHARGVLLAGRILDVQDPDLDGAVAEFDVDHVPHFHLRAGLGDPAVHADPLFVAGLLSDGPPLDQAGVLQILV